MPRPGPVLAAVLLVPFTGTAAAVDFFGELVDDSAQLYRQGSYWTLMAGSALTIAAMEIEDPAGDEGFLAGNGPLHPAEEFADRAFGLPTLGASTLLWLGGELAGDEETAETGRMLTEGLVLAGGMTAGLKLLTGRERPDGSDRLSFPSFHAAATFCTAAILWDRWGAGAGIPAGMIAVFTGVSRVDLGRHYPSDVLAGAAIGIAAGLAVSRAHGVESGDGTDGFRVGWDSVTGLSIGF
jgi:hypothetical protein